MDPCIGAAAAVCLGLESDGGGESTVNSSSSNDCVRGDGGGDDDDDDDGDDGDDLIGSVRNLSIGVSRRQSRST